MDFSSLPIASVDYSPAHWVKQATLVLEENELVEATHNRMERFWRVYFYDRHMYAPNLKELTVVLRPGYDPNTKQVKLDGINKFLSLLPAIKPITGLKVYLDNTSTYYGDICYSEIFDQPKELF